jgi:cell division protein FtsZ
VLINITGGYDMTLFEVDEAANRIRKEVDEDANIIFGSSVDETMNGRMRVSVVATGIDGNLLEKEKPTVISFARGRAAAAQRGAPTGGARAEAAASAPLLGADTAPPAAAPAPIPAATPAPVAQAQAPAPQPQQPAAPASRASETSFIPPRPVEPAVEPQIRHAQPLAVDPIAAADLANAGAAPVRESASRRGFNLFKQVTGLAARKAGAGAPAAPVAPQAPAAPKAEPRLSTPSARPAPTQQAPVAQPKLGGLEPPTQGNPGGGQEDLLDIPAFLRRQAN